MISTMVANDEHRHIELEIIVQNVEYNRIHLKTDSVELEENSLTTNKIKFRKEKSIY